MSLRHALLGLLVDRPASGYDLLRRFDISLATVWPATQSQVYSELRRLADAELIEVSAEGPRGRKEYTLTQAGLAELRHWLTETEPQRNYRNEVLMRVFFLGVLTKQQALDYLSGLAAQAAKEQQELAALDASITWDDDSLSSYGRLAMEYGHRATALRHEWAQWATQQIKNGPPSP